MDAALRQWPASKFGLSFTLIVMLTIAGLDGSHGYTMQDYSSNVEWSAFTG